MSARKFYSRRKNKDELGYMFGAKNFGFSIFIFALFILSNIRELINCTSIFDFASDYIFVIFFFLFIFIYNVIEILFYKRNLKIKKYGIKVNGYISKVEYKVRYKTLRYYLYVEYTDYNTGEKRVYKTPTLNFNPIEMLGSKQCGVYIYKKNVFVSDFVKNENEESIWSDEELNHLDEANLNKNYFFGGIMDIFSIIFVISVFFILFIILKMSGVF